MLSKPKIFALLFGIFTSVCACTLLILLLLRINIVNTNVNTINNSASLASEQQQQCSCNCAQSIEMDKTVRNFVNSVFAKPESLTVLWLIVVVNLTFSVVVCGINLTTLCMVRRDHVSEEVGLKIFRISRRIL